MAKKTTIRRGYRQGPAKLGELEVKRVDVSKINPSPYNPRKDLQPQDPEYQKLRRSIERFGYVDPLVWNSRTGNLVGGHQRLKILTAEFGAKKVDVAVVDLNQSEEKALNVALNKITGDWDDDALVSLLADLHRDESIDATLTGFDASEIDVLIDCSGEDEPASSSGPKTYSIIIDCKNKKHQRTLIRRLEKEGLSCRGLAG